MSKGMIINCPNCKYEGATRPTLKGSFAVEIALWLCAIAPGFIYSVWRRANKGYVCPTCNYVYVAKIGDIPLPPTLSEIIGNSIWRIIGIILCMTVILPLIHSIFMAIPIPIDMIIVPAIFLFLGTWLIVMDLRKKTKMIILATVMVLLVSIVSISKFIPKQQSMKARQDKISTTIENKDKAHENRQTELPGHDIGYTAHEIEELTTKISEKCRQIEFKSQGRISEIIEKIVIVYKLEMIQAGDTPREKQAVMEKINNMIDSEINAVEKQIEKERKLAEEGRKTKEILVSEQLANAIKNQGDIPKLTYGEQREIIDRQIQKETDRIKELKERMAASEKDNKKLLEKMDTLQAKLKAFHEDTAKAIVELERQ